MTLGAALCAEDVEKEEQRREKEEPHELLHAHHPRAGLGQKSQPGRLRAEQKIWRAHAGGDGEEHARMTSGGLGEGKTERGAEKRRSAGRSQDSRENALEK